MSERVERRIDDRGSTIECLSPKDLDYPHRVVLEACACRDPELDFMGTLQSGKNSERTIYNLWQVMVAYEETKDWWTPEELASFAAILDAEAAKVDGDAVFAATLNLSNADLRSATEILLADAIERTQNRVFMVARLENYEDKFEGFRQHLIRLWSKKMISRVEVSEAINDAACRQGWKMEQRRQLQLHFSPNGAPISILDPTTQRKFCSLAINFEEQIAARGMEELSITEAAFGAMVGVGDASPQSYRQVVRQLQREGVLDFNGFESAIEEHLLNLLSIKREREASQKPVLPKPVEDLVRVLPEENISSDLSATPRVEPQLPSEPLRISRAGSLEVVDTSRRMTMHQLLTHVEVVEYSKVFEAGTTAKAILNGQFLDMSPELQQDLFDDEGKLKPQAREELNSLIEQGYQAREILITSNIRLVAKIANARKFHSPLEYDDLLQVGTIGLMHAIEKFDYRKGWQFSTYATLWIKQHMDRAAQNEGKTIRLPLPVAEGVAMIERARKRLMLKSDRQPTQEELAKETNLPLAQVAKIIDAATLTRTYSLDMPISEDASFGDFISEKKSMTFEEAVVGDQSRRAIMELMQRYLTPSELQIMALRCGFPDGEPMTLPEISEQRGIPVATVRRWWRNTTEKLKKTDIEAHLRAIMAE